VLRTQTNRAGLQLAEVGPHFKKVAKAADHAFIDGGVGPTLVGAGGPEDLVERVDR
jgi:hypothetical protein